MSGAVCEAADEDWKGIAAALYFGPVAFRVGIPCKAFSLLTAGFPTEFDNRTSLGAGGRASAADGELAFGLYPGAVVGAHGETWMAVSRALSRGSRGSSLGGLSLAKLLDKHRGRRTSQRDDRLMTAAADRIGRLPFHQVGDGSEHPGDALPPHSGRGKW